MELEVKEIGILNGRKDYQCFCPICNLESRGYDKKLLLGSVKAHIEISHGAESALTKSIKNK